MYRGGTVIPPADPDQLKTLVVDLGPPALQTGTLPTTLSRWQIACSRLRDNGEKAKEESEREV